MKKAIALGLFIICGIGLYAQNLSWDIKFFQGRARESVAISQIIRMQTGDVFSIAITPASDCFSYVIAYDSERLIHVLHDQPLRRDLELTLGPMMLLPPSGTETIYVIISLQREARLETLIQDHRRNPDSRQHADALRREIVRLQSTASRLGEPASAFIPSGGTTRGVSTPEHATRFSGRDSYVRTITIRH